MSRIKADLSRVSLNQLCVLTGKTSRTLKKSLSQVVPEEESGTLYYDPVKALQAIYWVDRPVASSSIGEDEILDPVREKARLDRLKADKVELEVEQLRKRLIPVEQVEASWQKLTGAFRQKILNLPSKLSPRVCAAKEIKQIEKILKDECHEALLELSQYGDGIVSDRPKPKRG